MRSKPHYKQCSPYRGRASCSLKLRSGVDVSLEGAVDDLGADVDHVGHDGLVLGAVPGHVSRLSVSVSVGRSVVLMIDGGLSGPPLAVSVGHGGVLGQDLSQVPPEEVWVVDQRLGVKRVVVHHDGPRVAQTSAEAAAHEVDDPGISQPASHVEVLDWELSDEEETQGATKLGARGVVGPVEVRAVNGTGDNAGHVVAGEPASQL